ncbi:hypothetical protein BCR42DRAFT_487070 [Absidia repens]|uniref:Uncharacterized protein n=1 Tax=Absidia repens TaxID=90262 RepID=A0A1X2IVI9_9FUNG|nr:hypothetical protein BCR42DRAFT_487070 [Absidia repens]
MFLRKDAEHVQIQFPITTNSTNYVPCKLHHIATCLRPLSVLTLYCTSKMNMCLEDVLDVCLVDDNDCKRDGWMISSSRDTTLDIKRPVNALKHVNQMTPCHFCLGDATSKLRNVTFAQCLRTFVCHQRGLAYIHYNPNFQKYYQRWTVWENQTLGPNVDILSPNNDRSCRPYSYNRLLFSFHRGHTSWIFNALICSTKIINAGQDKKFMVLDFGYGLKTL